MLLNILLVILVLVCVALTGVILLQRSEGGALGMGGGPSGIFTARGAGDLLTRTTSILAAMFFVLSMGITLLASHGRSQSSVTDKLKVNPLTLQDLAKAQKPPAGPPQSSSDAAPPLPTAAPPLPTTATPPAMPNQAPRPTLRRTAQAAPAPHINLPEIGGAPANAPLRVPRPDVNAGAASSTPPANSQ